MNLTPDEINTENEIMSKTVLCFGGEEYELKPPMTFEEWSQEFYKALAGHTSDLMPDDIKNGMSDLVEMRKEFDAGKTPDEAASDEYDSWEASV